MNQRLDKLEAEEMERQGEDSGIDIIMIREEAVRLSDDTIQHVPVDGPFDPSTFEVAHESDGDQYRVWKAKPKPRSD